MPITLPRAGAGSVGTSSRRRGIRLPDAGDVPQVRTARDPGLRVPNFAQFAGGLEDVGAAISGIGDILQQEVDRQQKRHDATKTTGALLGFEKEGMEEFRRRQIEDDLARPNFMSDFENDLRGRLEKRIAGLEGVSDEALEKVRLQMQRSLQNILNSAGTKSLQAGKDSADDSIDAINNQAFSQAVRDPDFLESILDQLNDRLSPFKGTLTADQFRDKLSEGRADAILGAVQGYVRAGQGETAEILLASGRFDEDLTREQQSSAQQMIEVGARQKIADLDRAERLAEKELKETREFQHAKNIDGILEGTTTDADLDAMLENRQIDGTQFIAARKLLKAQERDSALEDDPAVVLSFTKQLEDGTLTTGEVYNAFSNKQITRERMDNFLGDIRRDPDTFQVKENKRKLRQNIGGEPGTLAELTKIQQQEINKIILLFEERTRGPNKEDPFKVRKELELQSGAIPLNQMPTPIFMRTPAGLPANKENMDVNESRKAVGRVLRQGKISAAQAAIEVQKINDIERARERQE